MRKQDYVRKNKRKYDLETQVWEIFMNCNGGFATMIVRKGNLKDSAKSFPIKQCERMYLSHIPIVE